MDSKGTNSTEESGLNRYHKLQAEAKELGITTSGNAEQLEAAIAAKKAEVHKTGLTSEEAVKIEARLKYEFEVAEKFKTERQVQIDRASIVTEAKSLKIPIDLPEKPTELELAQARQLLGMKKVEVKPSPETVAIESSKRGYYIFTNREQDDASHTVNLGGKYTIYLIPDQIHVLSDYHIRKWRQIATVPIYKRVPVDGPLIEGQMGEVCKRTGGKPRFAFDYLGEAPQDAPFGIVTDTKILDELKPQPLEVLS